MRKVKDSSKLKKSPAKTGRKQGRWTKGTSGNPDGRPMGSRNRATLAAQTLLDGEGERLTRKAIELALEGDRAALRLCLERLIPPCKKRPVPHAIPALSTSQDSIQAFASLAKAVASGDMTPGEAVEISKLVDAFLKALTVNELETRLRALEQQFGGGPDYLEPSTG